MHRSGKSYLLFKLFTDALSLEGIPDDNIVTVNLEITLILSLTH